MDLFVKGIHSGNSSTVDVLTFDIRLTNTNTEWPLLLVAGPFTVSARTNSSQKCFIELVTTSERPVVLEYCECFINKSLQNILIADETGNNIIIFT